MCLILFAYQIHPYYKLVVAANRDEFYERPTAPAAFWEEAPGVLAGRDLKAGGTWLGITRNGKFAAITNYRDLKNIKENAPSRGELVSGFLQGTQESSLYLEKLKEKSHLYNGFNLLVGDKDNLFFYSNIEDTIHKLSPGLYGLSNHLLDTPWPKVKIGKEELKGILAEEKLRPDTLLGKLRNTVAATDEDLPNTGVGLDWERILSPLFITTKGYGTRTSTALLIDRTGEVFFTERTYLPSSENYQDQTFRFKIDTVSSL